MPALPAVTGDFGDGDPLHAEARDGHLQVVELPGPDNGSDHFHRFGIVIGWIARFASAYAPNQPCNEVQVPCQPCSQLGRRLVAARKTMTGGRAPKIGALVWHARQNGAECLWLVRRGPWRCREWKSYCAA